MQPFFFFNLNWTRVDQVKLKFIELNSGLFCET